MGQEQQPEMRSEKKKKRKKKLSDKDNPDKEYWTEGDTMYFKDTSPIYELCPIEEDLWNAEYEAK
jgi:hypothetical protein